MVAMTLGEASPQSNMRPEKSTTRTDIATPKADFIKPYFCEYQGCCTRDGSQVSFKREEHLKRHLATAHSYTPYCRRERVYSSRYYE